MMNLRKILVSATLVLTMVLTMSVSVFADEGQSQNTDVEGEWTVRMYGENISSSTGNSMMDMRFWGSVIYESPKLTISYTLED